MDTQCLSSVNEMVLHPAYYQIVGMGPSAIPLILLELKTIRIIGFAALKAITGIDPVVENDMGICLAWWNLGSTGVALTAISNANQGVRVTSPSRQGI